MTPLEASVLIVVPAFGAPNLTDDVVGDLVRDDARLLPNSRIVVIDNAGDYVPKTVDGRVSVHRPPNNLRWIGSANWALDAAAEHGDSMCIVLNNDTRLSTDFAYWLAMTFSDCGGTAVAAACYDDFWLHQRARTVPSTAAAYGQVRCYRPVPFCDGTAIAFSTEAAGRLGRLDQQVFPQQGYGSDIDYALRARAAGYRCLVTEAAYVHHFRRGTMRLIPEETAENHRHEILGGLDTKWGPRWRAQTGLSDAAFPAHNTGSAADWYLEGAPWRRERPSSVVARDHVLQLTAGDELP